jgi:hypothetical protein
MIFKLEKKAHYGSKLFEVVEKHKTEPFNFDFKIKDNENLGDFKGSGIYVITYREFDRVSVIYIGLFRPYNKNDVRKIRWKKHIKTFTNRGHNIGLGKRVLDEINLEKWENFESIKPEIEKRVKVKKGCQTSKNRLKFAHDHWSVFNCNIAKLQSELEKFTFNYYQIKPQLSPENEQKKNLICESLCPNLAASIESYLLKKFAPECNKECNPSNNKSIGLEIIEDKLKGFLSEISKECKLILTTEFFE